MNNPKTINLMTYSGGEIYETSGAIPLGHTMDQEYCIPGTWKDNAQSAYAALNLIEEALTNILPVYLAAPTEREPCPLHQAEVIINGIHEVRGLIPS